MTFLPAPPGRNLIRRLVGAVTSACRADKVPEDEPPLGLSCASLCRDVYTPVSHVCESASRGSFGHLVSAWPQRGRGAVNLAHVL